VEVREISPLALGSSPIGGATHKPRTATFSPSKPPFSYLLRPWQQKKTRAQLLTAFKEFHHQRVVCLHYQPTVIGSSYVLLKFTFEPKLQYVKSTLGSFSSFHV
jgi:hypothetical protein